MEIKIDMQGKIPAIIVNGEAVSFKEGIQSIMLSKNWSRDDTAHYLKVSRRTVDGWCNGRKPSNPIIMALSFMLK